LGFLDDNTQESMETGADAAGDLFLRVVTGRAEAQHPLPRTGTVVLGRGEQADIRIEDNSVSRRHAVLQLGPRFSIGDLGSRHGVRVGGRRLGAGESAIVRLGEPIELGDAIILLRRAPAPSGPADETEDAAGVVVADPAMIALRVQLERFAQGNISVLLHGETGVGKEVFAHALHAHSPRADKPLLRLNCAAFSEHLLESELFGHERGAFTGAAQAKPGLLETAQGGTVFFDEIGELPLPLQPKLLRVIEERAVTRVGGLRPIAIDVRFISATNRDLEAEVAAGRFRQDLFFRLNGVRLHIPPLRERRSEIAPLARSFVREFARQLPFSEPELTPAALELVMSQAWPGNIRELRNAMERAVLLSRGEPLTSAHFPGLAPAGSGTSGFRSVTEPTHTKAKVQRAAEPPDSSPELWNDVEQLEKRRIAEALEQCGGNRTRAAKLLGVSRNTLAARIAKFGLDRPR
jgi:DNA-binding NtrC family response regulator